MKLNYNLYKLYTQISCRLVLLPLDLSFTMEIHFKIHFSGF